MNFGCGHVGAGTGDANRGGVVVDGDGDGGGCGVVEEGGGDV